MRVHTQADSSPPCTVSCTHAYIVTHSCVLFSHTCPTHFLSSPSCLLHTHTLLPWTHTHTLTLTHSASLAFLGKHTCPPFCPEHVGSLFLLTLHWFQIQLLVVRM